MKTPNRFIYALAQVVTVLAFVLTLFTITLYTYDAIHWVIAYPAGAFFILSGILSAAIIIKEERNR